MSNDKVAATFGPDHEPEVSKSCDWGAHEWCNTASCGCGCHRTRCPFTFRDYECTRHAGHDGEHRAHVSHDLARAYVIIPFDESTQPSESESPDA